ncbi:uncharacterized protein HMPREF1541_00668 [Cyphellophora europaea CBS 101466]|uniref:HhH-GPD domain-containing protein n=1 Tax=Cyphellophora europaea (strain CBS 101466) TaxID=1220924 RepID=W2SEN3_CYPE1|nr:uncharacterized protein HMPREF1541_00668 [Cyphellophora europaea CBS 101466]ETN46483.1 hypothetical protein HMPREF1541_00668 [Cyphellophora europaea CBS 101466]
MTQTRAQAKACATERQQTPSKKRRDARKEDKKTDTEPPAKKQKQTQKQTSKQEPPPESPPTSPAPAARDKLNRLIAQHGALPLNDTNIPQPLSPSPSTFLALLLNAFLSSARISHDLAAKTVSRVIQAGYHNLPTLKASSWQERTEVLTEGGYTRYREKTATALGELAELLEEKYDGDLTNLLMIGSPTPQKVRARLKEIKGLGDVGADIFFDTAQGICPQLAPFLDPRSVNTAQRIGIGGDVGVLWREIGKDPERMCRLAGALTVVRLEGREGEFKQES